MVMTSCKPNSLPKIPSHPQNTITLEVRASASEFFFNKFTFLCAGSLLLHGLSPVAVSRGYFSLRCSGFFIAVAFHVGKYQLRALSLQ